jgi:hypothetical protein
MPLPAQDLRVNLGTWAVPACRLPAVGSFLHDAAPNEPFDPHFHGQALRTTYFDSPAFALRRARRKGDRYLTVRVRCYRAPGRPEAYALSAKTESQKFRLPLDALTADGLLRPGPVRGQLADLLPADLQARLWELVGRGPDLAPVVRLACRRYAVEDDTDRYTLDVDVTTDTGLCLPAAVLEYKSRLPGGQPPGALLALGLRPIKLSKFLWATRFAGR